MVPSRNMLFWVAVLVVPMAGVGGMLPGTAALPLAIVAVFALVAIADAIGSRTTLAGIRVRAPDIVRLWKGRDGGIDLVLYAAPVHGSRPTLVALEMPPSMASPQQEMLVAFPENGTSAKFRWPCVASRRGNFKLSRCFLERASKYGLWNLRSEVHVDIEVRVYPDFLAERKRASSLFLNRGSFGIHARRHVGKGREFEQLREYAYGDSYEDIHWKAAAKRNQPVTKVFQVERTQELYVAVDCSRLTGRLSSDGTRMLERAVTAAALLARAAELQGDLFGLIAFSDRIDTFRRASGGRAARESAIEALYAREPREVTPDFRELFTFLRLRLRRRALVVILTCLDDPAMAESFATNIRVVCRQHLLLVNVLAPSVVRPLFTNESVGSTDDLYAELGGHMLWQNIRELRSSLRRFGVAMHQLDHEKLCAQLVEQYMRVKQRQAL